MSLEKSSIQWSAKQIKGMVMNGRISFDNIVQRSYVWERERKSRLIESMLVGFPVPVIYAKRSEVTDDSSNGRGNKTYDVLDGKQRLSTIKEYLNDEFALTFVNPISYYDETTNSTTEYDLTGKKFSDLPDALQDHLSTTTFTVTYFDNLTKDEERELFKRLNAGKPLSSKSRLLASCNDIESLIKMGDHPIFNEMLSDKAKSNKDYATIIMKMYIMLNNDADNVSFASKDFNPVVEDTILDSCDKEKILNILDSIYNIHEMLIADGHKQTAKKIYTETHLVAITPFVYDAMCSENSLDNLASWLVHFFETDATSISYDYNNACGSGNARTFNIVARNNALLNSYNEFFKSN